MTPQEHLDRAEQIISAAEQVLDREWGTADTARVNLAIAHALAAVAAELGVPHSTPPQ